MWLMSDLRRPLTPLLLALVALAWVTLIVLDQSPYGRYLSHHSLDEVRGGGSLMLVFVAGWLLMLVAMMLPTSLPLVIMFDRLARRRPDHMRLVGLLLAGYLSIWTLFGILVYLSDSVLHVAVARSPWLADHVSALSAGILLLAGVYQFTPLKYHCLDKCRSPFSFITEHWRGRAEQGQAFLLGIHHAVLSRLLLDAHAGDVCGGRRQPRLDGASGRAHGDRKNLRWGRRLSLPLGFVLLACGLCLLLGVFPASGNLIA